MKALLCKELGEDMVVEEVADPHPGTDEIVMDVHAAGLNFPDTLVVTGKYQFRPDLPFVPGGEAAGVVREVGAAVTNFKPGDRVISVGLIGAFAERRCVPARDLIPMPDSMSFEIGAGFMVTYGTSYYALKQCGNLQPGETLVVLGAAGGVGYAAVDLGHAMGAEVIAAASSDDKLDTASAAGASARINYSEVSLKDAIKSLTGGKGADVVYDPVGGDLTEQALRATAWNGRLLVVGFASGTIPAIPINLTLLKNNAIKGVFYGAWTARQPEESRRNISELFSLFEAGKLHPLVSEVFSLEQHEEAFAALTERRARGKILFQIGND